MKLTSEPIYIRFIEPEDAQAMLDLRLNNRSFLKPFEPARPESYFTIAEQRTQIKQNQFDREKDRAYMFGVFLSGTDELIGRIALTNLVRGSAQFVDLGYFMSQEHNGKGYTTKAVRLVVKFCFEQLRLHRVQAGVMPRNTASNRVMQKAGFRLEGLAKRMIQINGVWEDHNLYAITAEDYEEQS